MRNIRLVLFSLVICYLSVEMQPAMAQLLPNNRRTDWSQVGYPHPYPTSERVLNVQILGAKGDGTTDDQPVIQAAIDSLGGRRGVVYFPIGDYLLNSALTLHDSIILKGEGMSKSRLLFNFHNNSGDCIRIETYPQTVFQPLLVDGLQGANRIRVQDASSFVPGEYIEIHQENGDWDTQPADWAQYSVGQIIRITQIAGDELILKTPLRTDYTLELKAEIRSIDMRHEVGIECVGIQRLDHPAGGYGYNIAMTYARDCWIRGVESYKSVGSHMFLRACSDVTLERNLVYDAFEFDGGSTRGYGITLAHHSGQVLVQDNIFQRLRHAMMVKQGANGNVFAYNYSTEVIRSEFPSDFSGDISLHGHYAFGNLFEGNVVQQIVIDHYWGPSGPYNTFFRNRAEGYGILLGSLDSNARLSDSQNFMGNEVTHQLGFPGYFLLMGQDHFSLGNHLGDSISPEKIEELEPASLFYEEKPEFWGDAPWPGIGIPIPYNSRPIPAQLRATSDSELRDCEELRIHTDPGPGTSLFEHAEIAEQWYVEALFPNPFHSSISLELSSPRSIQISISILTNSGAQLSQRDHTLTPGKTLLTISTKSEWAAGLYIVRVKADDQEYNLKVRKE